MVPFLSLGAAAGGGVPFERIALSVLLALAVLIILTLLVQWWMWLAAVGRFRVHRDGPRGAGLYPRIFAEALVALVNSFIGIVNEFRHFLALVLLSVFFITLILVIVIGWERTADDAGIEAITDGIQLVVASLGGLIGSIVGYYYGESAAKRAPGGSGGAIPVEPTASAPPASAGATTDTPSPTSAGPGVKPATPPPGLGG